MRRARQIGLGAEKIIVESCMHACRIKFVVVDLIRCTNISSLTAFGGYHLHVEAPFRQWSLTSKLCRCASLLEWADEIGYSARWMVIQNRFAATLNHFLTCQILVQWSNSSFRNSLHYTPSPPVLLEELLQ